MYREVTMIEVREVLRLRGEGLPKKRIAAQLGLDPRTVRRYLTAAQGAGVHVTATMSDEEVLQVSLDHIRWRRARQEIRQAKTGRPLVLPLLADVADASTAYLRQGRPASSSRAIFVRHRAPSSALRTPHH